MRRKHTYSIAECLTGIQCPEPEPEEFDFSKISEESKAFLKHCEKLREECMADLEKELDKIFDPSLEIQISRASKPEALKKVSG